MTDVFAEVCKQQVKSTSGFLLGCCCPNADSWTVLSGFQPITPHMHTHIRIYICLALQSQYWWAQKEASLVQKTKVKKRIGN